MSNRKIRVAVIGAGNMGKNHLRNYFLLPQADLIGLADINPATRLWLISIAPSTLPITG